MFVGCTLVHLLKQAHDSIRASASIEEEGRGEQAKGAKKGRTRPQDTANLTAWLSFNHYINIYPDEITLCFHVLPLLALREGGGGFP
jgi:hypothetical protein